VGGMMWHPLMTQAKSLKLRLKLVTSRADARQEFDEFVAGNPSDAELELASMYYARCIYELSKQ
jgi:hypothetical protein